MAEMLEKPELRTNTSTEILVDHLYNWMLSDTPVLERVLETVTALPTSIDDAPPDPPLPQIPSIAGKRAFTTEMKESARRRAGSSVILIRSTIHAASILSPM